VYRKVTVHRLLGKQKRKILTDRTIVDLKPAPQGKRYDAFDGIVPGLVVRVTDKGNKSFVLITRYPGSRHWTRRSLGEFGVITLAAAREQARSWLDRLTTTEKAVQGDVT
jgi:hypothetical protein